VSGLGHQMIMASAGSGKTYALTTRFVRLLALGAAPERIVALTFTRKAAGEFFDAILTRLANAASDEKAATKLAGEIERAGLHAADFLGLLAEMIRVMPRLNLGTLDGFFARMVQAFPLELGLTGEFELLEESAARQERQRVLGLIFGMGGTATQARDDFIESFKRATYGVEEKALQRSLDSFLDQHGEIHRSAPDRAAWGNAARIWPTGNPTERGGDLTTRAQALETALDGVTLTEKQRQRMTDFFSELAEWVAGATLPKNVDFVVKKTLEVAEDLRAGQGEVMIDRKKIILNPEQGREWLGVVEAIVATEFNRKLEITRGIFDVLAFYETVYHDQVRRGGKLTFADVQRLLEPGSGRGLSEEDRQLIDWRLDARFEHWLLDEFQDTSRGQWAILHNLVDEAVQDPEGQRSLFYVGDVKQAIYAWRGGDSRLFREIFDYYNAASSGVIEEGHLDMSWRSGEAVIAMVNEVCGSREGLGEIAPPATVDRWLKDWRMHRSANRDLPGFAELREVEDEAARFAETLSILKQVDPMGRGLTAAVLVQRNDTGAKLAEYLRKAGGLAALAESDLRIALDNPLTSALLALLKSAAHPGDSMAAELVKMTPLAKGLMELGWAKPAEVSRGILGEIHTEGFAGMLAKWLRRIEPLLAEGDIFSRLRGNQLVEAARAFDQQGERSVARFIEWIEAHSLREAVSPGVIRVLTVHKAKGLGFDVVILPDLQGQTIVRRRDGLAVHRDAAHEVKWVLDLPVKLLAESDPILREQLENDAAEGAYEALCKLYVALTRAKRALYVVIESVGRSRSLNYPKLLSTTLGSGWRAGDEDWFLRLEPNAKEGEGGEAFAFAEETGEVQRLVRREAHTPSAEKQRSRPGKSWFTQDASDAAKRGTSIHKELARIKWVEDIVVEDWAVQRGLAGGDSTLITLVRSCLEKEELKPVFYRPTSSGGSDVWVERPFEVVIGNRWVSGVFDRVVLASSESGRPKQAWVYDFKTDGVKNREEAEVIAKQYDEQVTLYRQVVGKLTGLTLENVRAELVFTAIGCRVQMG